MASLSCLGCLRGRQRVCGWLESLFPRRARNWIRHGCSNFLTNTFPPQSPAAKSSLYVGGSLPAPPKRRLLGWAALGTAARNSALRRGPKAKDQVLAGRLEGARGSPWDQAANARIKHRGPASSFGLQHGQNKLKTKTG